MNVASIGTSCDSEIGVGFIHQKSFIDASIDVFLPLRAVLGDRVELLEHCKVISLAILELDPQKGNKSFSLLFLPYEVWEGADAQTKSNA